MLNLAIEATDDAAGCGEEYVTREAGILYAQNQLRKNTNTDIHCRGCGDEIPEERREIIPGCLYCIQCQGHVDSHTSRVGEPMEYVFGGFTEKEEEDTEEEDETPKKRYLAVRAGEVTTVEAFNQLLDKIDSPES